MDKLKYFAPVVLRIGIAIVFIWFGANQFIDTKSWFAFVPQWVSGMTGLSQATLVHLNGAFEIIFGSALLLGFYTRLVAFLLAFHMFDITFIVGLDSIGMRDLGLSFATTAIWLFGRDWLTLDRYMRQE